MLVLADKGLKQRIDVVAFAPTGRALLAAGNGSWLDVWNLDDRRSERHLRSANLYDHIFQARFIDGGRAVAIAHGEGGLRVHPLTPASVYPAGSCGVTGSCCEIAVSADDRTIVGTTRRSWQLGDDDEANGIVCWAETGRQFAERWDHRIPIRWCYGVALSPDETHFAMTECEAAVAGERETAVVIRDTCTGKPLDSFPSPAVFVEQLLYNPAGGQLVARYRRVIAAWSTDDFSRPPQKVINDTTKEFTGLAFHPSGKYLAAASNDSTIKLYDTTTWAVARTFTWEIGRMRSVAFSPDGTLAAAGSDKGKVVVWDVDV